MNTLHMDFAREQYRDRERMLVERAPRPRRERRATEGTPGRLAAVVTAFTRTAAVAGRRLGLAG